MWNISLNTITAKSFHQIQIKLQKFTEFNLYKGMLLNQYLCNIYIGVLQESLFESLVNFDATKMMILHENWKNFRENKE